MMKPALAFLALTLLALAPAEAALTVCNKAAGPARVALGRFDGRDWASEGWWLLAPGKCADVVTGKLDARYYYLYATDGDAGSVGRQHELLRRRRRKNSRFPDAAIARGAAMIASNSSASTPTTT